MPGLERLGSALPSLLNAQIGTAGLRQNVVLMQVVLIALVALIASIALVALVALIALVALTHVFRPY